MANPHDASDQNARLEKLQQEIDNNIRALEALKREQLFSEKVLDSLPGIFYLYDENGNLFRWNKNHETLTGFSAEELPKRKMLDWFSEEDRKRVAERVATLFTNGVKDALEADLVIKDGKKIPYYFTGTLMTVEGKNYLLGMGIDLTEIKKVQEDLRKSEEKYRAIFENAVEGIFQTTIDGRFISANPSMAHLLRYDTPGDLIAAVTDIKKQLYVSQESRDDFIRQIRIKNIIDEFEVQFYRKDGTIMWASINARPVFDEQKNIVFIEGILSDITEQKLATEALREREEYLRKENIRLRHTIKDRYKFGEIIGKSAAMQEVYELILKASATDANIIIYGESGTGKELVANAIHEMSDRKEKKFVPVHCGAIPENLLESEFFGYKKGAFTGANADKRGYLDLAAGGTLFLDELGEISLSLQVKLLRVLEGKGYTPVGGNEVKKTDIRIIAATNRNLKLNVEKGLIREDFFYRVHIIPITIPPLRERREDIPLLIEHFMNIYSGGKPVPPLTGEMLYALLNHRWPGNVRELQNVVYRYIALKQFDLEEAVDPLKTPPPKTEDLLILQKGNGYASAMSDFEKKLIRKALEQNRWHREKTAASLGLPMRTFFRKIKKYGLIRQK